MNGTLKVTTSKLTSTASSFQSTGNQVKNLTTQMTTIVKSLSGQIWSGEAASAYIKKFDGMQDDISKIKMINEHVTDLQEMAREYEAAENTNVSAANALSSDVIV